VGQSLYSSHLDAVYASNHAFIDPQIWYDEHETRKQVEQSAGCFILTAQEKPENARKMREDLFKKTMSADGIAGRRPYGMSTRMIELVGWKRYEVNSMVRFSGVTEKTFPSAHRRGFVWLPKARFIDGNFIANQYPDASMDGYFAKDDDLKSFLRSGPCVAASLRLQHAFESTHDAQACRDLIEAYAAKPLTEDAMREACGLPLRQRSDQVHANINLPVDKSSQDERDQLHEQLKNLLPAVMEIESKVKKITENDKVLTSVMEIGISELLRKLDSEDVTPKEIHETMEACAKNRDEIIRDELKMSRKQGKKMLHQVLFGANLPTALSGNEFMQKFQKASVYLKWLACSLLPKVYERDVAMEKSRLDPEVSAQGLCDEELCASPVERVEEQIDAESLKRGNCIPLAMARLLPAKKAQILQALTASNHKNAEAEQSGSRCYNFLLKEMSIWAAPRLGLDTSKPGNYLLHMEDKGTPHCIACRVRDNELVELWDGLHKTRLLLPELVQLSEEAVDSNTIVTFQLFENDVEREPSHTKERSAAAVLLQMRAEAGSDDECDIGGSEDEEPVVRPGDHLLSLLRQEVQQQLTSKCTEQRKCPFWQYLARSAEILKSTVQPGPEFWMVSSLSRTNSVRRVRNLYYTK
ncbi:unnamed protein product, partial [Symbiodinium microadriaticum]